MANQRRSVEKEAYWRGQLDRQSTSGLSIRRWCRESGVSEPTFYVWRRELRKRDHERELTERDRPEPLSEVVVSPGFVAVDVLTPDVVTSGAVPSDREAKLEIDVAGGIVIRLREDASAEILERVLTVVCGHGIARQGAARHCMGGGSRGEVESC